MTEKIILIALKLKMLAMPRAQQRTIHSTPVLFIPLEQVSFTATRVPWASEALQKAQGSRQGTPAHTTPAVALYRG